MKYKIFLMIVAVQLSGRAVAQDTFSILAFDSITRQVGAAGASCLDLFSTPFSNNDFICEVFPDTGAIASQAAYIPVNQANARARMRAGDSPQQIMAWLNANDAGGSPNSFTTRQYGAVRMGSSPASAAFTGTACMSYKSHRIGPNYTIHGNILLGAQVIDSMEARFLREKGDLACKLMAAMQGANMVGADSRCTNVGTSSLFAFLKVTQPADTFGKPSFYVSVRTHTSDQEEPIDSLQILFDASGHSCVQPNTSGLLPNTITGGIQIFPNPGAQEIIVMAGVQQNCRILVSDLTGRTVHTQIFNGSCTLNVRGWKRGLYIFEIQSPEGKSTKKVLVE